LNLYRRSLRRSVEVGNSGFQHGNIVLEVSKTDVAPVAEKTSDVTEFVAVINVKTSATSALFAVANCAFAILFGQHLVICTWTHAVHLLSAVVFKPFRVREPVAFLFRSAMREVIFSPLSMSRRVTRLAINAVPSHSSFRFVELIQRLFYQALRTDFETGREVEINSARHVVLPFYKSHCTSNFSFAQGVF
jgi:hypothetical protein